MEEGWVLWYDLLLAQIFIKNHQKVFLKEDSHLLVNQNLGIDGTIIS